MTASTSFQQHYPEETRYCYGCGPLNDQGLHIESFWDGKETICRFEPKPYHTAMPGYVYGGLIASLIDCHGTGSAAASPIAPRAESSGPSPCSASSPARSRWTI